MTDQGIEWVELDPSAITMGERIRSTHEETVERIIASIGDPRIGRILQPIIVTPELVLIDGAHRLTAALRSDMATVPCGIFHGDLTDEIKVGLEYATNVLRKEVNPIERYAMWVHMAEIRSSDERDSGKQKKLKAKELVGLSEATLASIGEVLAVADSEDETPLSVVARSTVQRMKDTGNVSELRVYERAVKKAREQEAVTSSGLDADPRIADAVSLARRLNQILAETPIQTLAETPQNKPHLRSIRGMVADSMNRLKGLES